MDSIPVIPPATRDGTLIVRCILLLPRPSSSGYTTGASSIDTRHLRARCNLPGAFSGAYSPKGWGYVGFACCILLLPRPSSSGYTTGASSIDTRHLRARCNLPGAFSDKFCGMGGILWKDGVTRVGKLSFSSRMSEGIYERPGIDVFTSYHKGERPGKDVRRSLTS